VEIIGIIIGAILLVAFVAAMREFAAPTLILKLAGLDVGWSPFRFRSPPGNVIMLAKGRERGEIDQILPSDIPGWHYHEKDGQFYPENKNLYPKGMHVNFKRKFPKGPPKRSGYLDRIGVVRVPLFRHYYRRNRRYDTWDLQKGTSEYGVVSKETKKGEDHLFYFATTMAVELRNVPTKNNFPANIILIFNVLLISPRKAEFLAGKWEIQAIAAVTARAREYISSKTADELREERDEVGPDDFLDHILLANNVVEGETGTIGLLPAYGIMIQGPRYTNFDLESGKKEMVDAMQRKIIAEKDLETAKVLAKKTVVEANAEAKRIDRKYGAIARHKDGAQIATAEAILASSPSTLLIGGGMVAVPPAASDPK